MNDESKVTNVVDDNMNNAKATDDIYYNGTSFIRLMDSECVFYNVNYDGKTNIRGTGSSYYKGSGSFTTTLDSYTYGSDSNRQSGTDLDVQGTSTTNSITVGGTTYTK